ncbi:MAG: hypothetical protein Q8R92_08915 [Deltaproteobacteria bacterium]|nr:hypothetical protein [Deltaproteobacteria bacterium]
MSTNSSDGNDKSPVPPTDMLERVVDGMTRVLHDRHRALVKIFGEDSAAEPEPRRDLELAVAAIEAYEAALKDAGLVIVPREPTEGMFIGPAVLAGVESLRESLRGPYTPERNATLAIWRAMIDAALGRKP